MRFEDLGLTDEVLRAVADSGYETPTPIQEKAIPYILMNRDVLGCAQTGTGKTASFVLPMLDILAHGRARARMPRSLILEPTRELAAQVAENFDTYGKHQKLNKALLIGGVSFDEQVRILERGADVLIATPGRLLDHFERGRVLLSDVRILVIDEADRMLDMGFIPDVERIVKLMPRIRQTLMFSATMPPVIRKLASQFLMNPKEISVAPPATASATVTQALVVVEASEKRDVLRKLIEEEKVGNALIFCNRKRDVGVVHRSLQRHGFDVGALHGDMDQFSRTDTLAAFKAGKIKMLVCSDVAARGLDIQGMSHVFNFDVPTHAEDYVHRIGRTGRAGREGRAITIATPEDGRYLAAIRNLAGAEIPRLKVGEVKAAEVVLEESGTSKRRRRPRRGEKRTETKSSGGVQSEKRPVAEGRSESRPASRPESSSEDRPESRPVAKDHSESRPVANRPPEGRAKGRPDRQPKESQKKQPTTGFGDHVPAFMMRPDTED